MSNTIRLSIPGMRCGGCVSAIEKTLSNEVGVLMSEVDLASKSPLVESDNSLAVLVGAVRAAGFDTSELAADDQDLVT